MPLQKRQAQQLNRSLKQESMIREDNIGNDKWRILSSRGTRQNKGRANKGLVQWKRANTAIQGNRWWFFFALMGAWVNILKRHEKCFFSSTPSHTYLSRTKFLGLHPLIFKRFSPHTFHLEKKTEVFSAEGSSKQHFFRLHPGPWVDLKWMLTCKGTSQEGNS